MLVDQVCTVINLKILLGYCDNIFYKNTSSIYLYSKRSYIYTLWQKQKIYLAD
jgi:hypothetical protein